MKTNIITREGYEILQQELNHLWKVERPETTKKVSWAASLGDRSENADYQYNKKRLREIDRRVRYLRKRLEDVKIVDYSPQQDGKVFFGAWVTVEDEEGEEHRYQVVGPDEYDPDLGKISVVSPVGKALMGKQVDDEVTVKVPRGISELTVLAIDYDFEE